MESDRLLGVELRHLAALQAVARHGSFGRAALSLGYTQSAVSQQIAALERLVGEKLVERPGGPRAVSLTAAGELLLRHADAIMARLAAAQADLAALKEGSVGSLRVGTYQSVGARILPTLLRRYREDWPLVEVHLAESASDPDLLDQVERGELDLTVAMLPLPDGPFEAVELLSDPYVVVVPADSPLTGLDEPVRLADVADEPIIGAKACRSWTRVETHMEARGLQPRLVFLSDDNDTVQGLVAAGVGLALRPLLAVDTKDERIAVLELEPRVPHRVIVLAWHRDRYRTPAARAFVETAIALCAELGHARRAVA
jgi:molybdate transport repressor ModE-like protein